MNTFFIPVLQSRDYDDQHELLQVMPQVNTVELIIGIETDEWLVETTATRSEVLSALHDGAEYAYKPYWETDVYKSRMEAHFQSIATRIREL